MFLGAVEEGVKKVRDRIDILMKNVEIEWRLSRGEREACLDALVCHNESAANRIMLLHALAVSEVAEGRIDLEAAQEIFPGYPGLYAVLPILKRLLQDNFPSVVWYSQDKDSAEINPPEITQCNLCIEEPWEEAILCPNCYGSGKVFPRNVKDIKTVDVFISNNVFKKIL